MVHAINNVVIIPFCINKICLIASFCIGKIRGGGIGGLSNYKLAPLFVEFLKESRNKNLIFIS